MANLDDTTTDAGVERNPDGMTELLKDTLRQLGKEEGANVNLATLWMTKQSRLKAQGEDGSSAGETALDYMATGRDLRDEYAYFSDLLAAQNTRCTQHLDCPIGFDCVGGWCTMTEESGLVDQGQCRLEMPDPDLTETCEDDNGCEYVTCGVALDGKPNCCGGQVWTIRGQLRGQDENGENVYGPPTYSCEDPNDYQSECDVRVDRFVKRLGYLPDWDNAGSPCDPCKLCRSDKTPRGTASCQPWPVVTNALDDPPCFCPYAEYQCKNTHGPCYSCDPQTGRCVEDCADCVATCSDSFFCPCDYNEKRTRFTINTSVNPCAGVNCYDEIQNQKELICNAEFPCVVATDRIPCTKGCENLSLENVACPNQNCLSQPLLDANCPDDKICHYTSQYLNTNEFGDYDGTGIVHINICDPIPLCGCAAPRTFGSEHFVRCDEPCFQCTSYRNPNLIVSPDSNLPPDDFGLCRVAPDCDTELRELRPYWITFKTRMWYVEEAGTCAVGATGPYRKKSNVSDRYYSNTTYWRYEVQSTTLPRLEFFPQDIRQEATCDTTFRTGFVPHSVNGAVVDFMCTDSSGGIGVEPIVPIAATVHYTVGYDLDNLGPRTLSLDFLGYGNGRNLKADTRTGCRAGYPQTRRYLTEEEGWGPLVHTVKPSFPPDTIPEFSLDHPQAAESRFAYEFVARNGQPTWYIQEQEE